MNQIIEHWNKAKMDIFEEENRQYNSDFNNILSMIYRATGRISTRRLEQHCKITWPKTL